MKEEREGRARCVRCGHTVDLAGQCPNCLDDGRDDCLPQAGGLKLGESGMADYEREVHEAKPYIDPAPKNPATLDAAADGLETVVEVLGSGGTLGAIKLRGLRHAVIQAALKVRGCASEWRMERVRRDREAVVPKHKLLFFGPSVAEDRVVKDMQRTGTLPESEMDDRINQMMREGWRVTYRHFDPSFVVQQWRVIMEKD